MTELKLKRIRKFAASFEILFSKEKSYKKIQIVISNERAKQSV